MMLSKADAIASARSCWRRSRIGSVLAVAHFGIVSVLVLYIAFDPGTDWYWWPVAPFALDFPFSILVHALLHALREIPVPGFVEEFLVRQREPYGSLGLFWFPAA